MAKRVKQRKYTVLEQNLTAKEHKYPILDRTERGPHGLINRKNNLVVCMDTNRAAWKVIAKCNSLAQAANVANAAHNFAVRNGIAKRYKVA